MFKFRRNTFIKFTSLAVCGLMAVALTGCSSAEIPDLYDYDDLSEYIKLCDYKGLEYEATNTEVTSSEVMEKINEELQEHATTKKLDSGTVENNSVVIIDYEGKLDGKVVDGAVAENQTVDMAESNYVDGFADSLLGHKVGETFDANVTFPDDYAPELAGKTVVFTMKIKALQKTVVPEYTDEYVKENTDFDSKEEYEKDVKKKLQNERKSDAEDNEKMELYNQLIANSEVIKFPEKELKIRQDSIADSYKSVAKDNDKAFEEYLKTQMNMTLDEFDKQTKASAEDAVKQELVLYQIARLENIKISKDEYNKYLEKLLKDAGYTKSTYKEENGISIEEYAEKNNLFTSLLYSKVMDKVLSYSVSK